MGKYTLTRTMQNDRNRHRSNPDSVTFSGTGESLLDSPRNEGDFRLQAFLYGFDPTGIYRGYIDQRDLTNYWNDYFKNTGLSWSDVKYPSMMRGFGSQGNYGRSMLVASKNLSRLYR